MISEIISEAGDFWNLQSNRRFLKSSVQSAISEIASDYVNDEMAVKLICDFEVDGSFENKLWVG